jgi:DNA-binding MarR family transcriptional regulator
MDKVEHLIVPIWQAFVWLDDGLQSYLRKQGWPEVTRPQSMVMTNVIAGVRRPSDIARNLGVSRQAIHVTLRQMIDLGLLVLIDDPEDGRSKIVAIGDAGGLMRENAKDAMRLMTEELRRRIGDENVEQIKNVLLADWGASISWDEPDLRGLVGAAKPSVRPGP